MTAFNYEKAQDFLWKNARLLERRMFAYLFLGEPCEPVITALRAYQNADGGFGNALEPDKRDPHSLPVDVERALLALDSIGALNDPVVQRELLLPACDFLASITTEAGGVPFSLPTAKLYPHAPWWAVDDNPPADLNPTADIVGLLTKAGIRHPWIDRASQFCWDAIAESESTLYHTLLPVISFLQYAPDRPRAEQELARVLERIRTSGVVEMNPEAKGYVKMPLDWAPTPDSACRQLFDDALIAAHLKALATHQLPDGGWTISWDPISPGVDLEWRGIITLDVLRTLRAYGSL